MDDCPGRRSIGLHSRHEGGRTQPVGLSRVRVEGSHCRRRGRGTQPAGQRDFRLDGRRPARRANADGFTPPVVRRRSGCRPHADLEAARRCAGQRRHHRDACFAQSRPSRLCGAARRTRHHDRSCAHQADPREHGPLALAAAGSGQAVSRHQRAGIHAAPDGQRQDHQELPHRRRQAGTHRDSAAGRNGRGCDLQSDMDRPAVDREGRRSGGKGPQQPGLGPQCRVQGDQGRQWLDHRGPAARPAELARPDEARHA